MWWEARGMRGVMIYVDWIDVVFVLFWSEE
jgi:hypothetical protein